MPSPTVDEIIELYEKHGVEPSPSKAFPYQTPDRLCLVGIVALDEENRVFPYEAFTERYDVRNSLEFALDFDKGFREGMGEDYGSTVRRDTPGYSIGQGVAEWWKNNHRPSKNPPTEDKMSFLWTT